MVNRYRHCVAALADILGGNLRTFVSNGFHDSLTRDWAAVAILVRIDGYCTKSGFSKHKESCRCFDSVDFDDRIYFDRDSVVEYEYEFAWTFISGELDDLKSLCKVGNLLRHVLDQTLKNGGPMNGVSSAVIAAGD